MKSVIFIIALLGVSAFASNAEYFNSFASLKSNELANNEYGKTVVSLMELKLENTGSLDSILALLHKLAANVEHKQKLANEDKARKNAHWNKEIAGYEAVIKQLTHEINALMRLIGKTNAEISSQNSKLRNLRKQLSLLGSKRAELVAARKADEAAFLKRQEEQNKVVVALTDIISKLQTRLNAGNAFIQKSEIVDVLKKVGPGNPFVALVELSMTFDVAELKNVIAKVTELRSYLEASLANSVKLEENSIKNYNVLMTEMGRVKVNLHKEIAATQAEINRLHGVLSAAKTTLSQKRTLRANNRANLKHTHEEQDAYNKNYREETATRTSEVRTINVVVSILKGKSATIHRAEKLSH